MPKWIFIALLSIFWGSIFMLSLVIYLPETAIDSRPYQGLKKIFPQGWAFFTRSPRESQTQLFQFNASKDQWEKVEQQHAQVSNFFGASKKMTQLSYELKDVFSQIATGDYIDCASNIQIDLIDCPVNDLSPIEIKLSLDQPFLQGEYLVVVQAIIPWAWSKNKNEIKMPSKVARIQIL